MDFLTLSKKLPHFPSVLVCFILATVPLLFGAVHPIVQSYYVALILICLGGWLLYIWPTLPPQFFSIRVLWPILVVLLLISLQSIPLPLEWIGLVSPARAERVRLVNELAGTSQYFITLSDHGLISLQRVLLVLALLIYYFSVKVLLHRSNAFLHTLALIIILVGFFEAVYGLFQFLNPRIGILWLSIKSRAAQGTIIYRNQYASLLNMCWPIALAAAVVFLRKSLARMPKKRKGRSIQKTIKYFSRLESQVPLALSAAGVMLLAVLFSLSRGGMISMLLVMILLGFLLPLTRKTKIIVGCLLLLVICGYGMLLDFDTILQRFGSIGKSGSTRFGIYLASVPMLLDHWITGIGLGSYTVLSPIYLKGFPPNLHFDRAHCEYLEIMIELGIPVALLLFCWIGVVMVRSGGALFRQLRKRTDSLDYALLYGSGAFCAIVGFLCHGLVDFGWRLPANLVYVLTLAAILSHSLDSPKLAMFSRTP